MSKGEFDAVGVPREESRQRFNETLDILQLALSGRRFAYEGEIFHGAGDVASPRTAHNHFGRVDILIHNAGTVRRGSLKELSYQDFDAVLDVHLRGAFHVVRPAFPVMCAAGYGRIVLTSSIGGMYGNQGVANYAAAKAGLIGLSNVVALEGAAEGVLCNVIVPSAVTRMAEGLDISAYPPMGPELVAPVVGFLAHESCSVNGEILVAIAGRVARAVIAESPGVQRLAWTIEDVAEQLYAVRDLSEPLVFPVVPQGHADHIGYSFESAAWAIKENAQHG